MSDVQAVVAQMSLEEKAALCTGASNWTTTPVPRLNLPEMLMSDGPHGMRRIPDRQSIVHQSLPATCFPTASCLASTWDSALLYELGQALGAEAIAMEVDLVLGPGVNIKRSPLSGRNFEYYSEDPYLSGELAASLIDGVQSKGIGTALKHFAANNQEFERFSISVEIDERALREIYLPAFEKAVTAAQPWAVMCAYNKVNGTYASEHRRLLTDILKREWGFAGFVLSDWGAVHDRVASLKAGLDLEMPGPKQSRVNAVIEAVRDGRLDEAVLNEAVGRILGIVQRAAQTPKGCDFDVSAHHELARKVAAEGMVLLKNNGLLPLHSPQCIAVIGRAAHVPHFQGGGSSFINPTRVDIPFVELQKLAGNAELLLAEGYPEDHCYDAALIDQAVAAAQAADVALLYIALPAFKESEGYDRTDMDLTRQQVALIQAVTAVQPNTVVILNNGAPVAMQPWIDGAAAVLEAWMMGQAGGGAIADVLFGKTNPSGKLAETFPIRLADTPAFLHYPGENGHVHYGEGLFVGYRYYDSKDIPVQFPFGHGLSYTTFAYDNPRASAPLFRDVDGLTVAVDVTNTGPVAGKEVVQVYVHDQEARLIRPYKELKGFAKVPLQPGETKMVNIPLDFRAFAYYDPAYQQWVTESGQFDILIGASATDIRCKLTVTLQSTLQLPSVLHRESTIRAWLEDPRGKVAFEPMYRQMAPQLHRLFGEGGKNIGMDAAGFLLDMPLLNLLYFQEDALTQPADDIVDLLLAQVNSVQGPAPGR